MRIVCPACAAAYEVPDDRFTTGRRIRCANCGETWLAVGARPAADPEDPPAQLTPAQIPNGQPPPVQPPADPFATPARPVAAVRRPVVEPLDPKRYDRLVGATQVSPPPPRSPVWIGWAATVVILAAAVWGGYTFRTAVMTAWPPSTRVYAALGLVR